MVAVLRGARGSTSKAAGLTDGVHSTRLRRSSWTCLLAAAGILSGVLVAGCGSSSPHPGTATTGGASAASGGSATGARSGAPGAGGAERGQLAYARCMRAHGVEVEAQPGNRRGAVVIGGRGANPESLAFQRAQAQCKQLLPNVGLPGSGPPPSTQTLDKLLRIARCMRQHGISEFPDPRTAVPPSSGLSPGKYREITDYDGAILLFPATIDMQAPAYRHALTACGAPPLGLHH
jgi:hypothetical protein